MKKLLGGLVLISLLFSCEKEVDEVGSASYPTGGDTQVIPVEGRLLEYGKLISQVEGSGIVRGREEVWSTSETGGTVTEVLVSPGDYLEEGSPLLTTDDTLAYWDMKRAEQQLKASQFEYEGTKNSFETGAVSELEYNRAYTNWYNSKSSYESALKVYNNSTPRAPISGYVSQMNTSLTPGYLLQPGTPLLKIINTEEFMITLYVGQREVGLIHPGSPGVIYIELADQLLQFKGTLLDISAGSDDNTGNFPVRVIWQGGDDSPVKSGMNGRISLETEGEATTLIVPFDSLVEREGKQWVFLAQKEGEGYRAVVREVTQGRRMGNRIEITTGLEAGEILILTGLNTLYPGAEVKLTYREEGL
jgi:membrane fusion protein, multidrug efflux system